MNPDLTSEFDDKQCVQCRSNETYLPDSIKQTVKFPVDLVLHNKHRRGRQVVQLIAIRMARNYSRAKPNIKVLACYEQKNCT
jgi:hypothetical protein